MYISCVPSSEYMFFRLLVVLRSVCDSLKTQWSPVSGGVGGGVRGREQPQSPADPYHNPETPGYKP